MAGRRDGSKLTLVTRIEFPTVDEQHAWKRPPARRNEHGQGEPDAIDPLVDDIFYYSDRPRRGACRHRPRSHHEDQGEDQEPGLYGPSMCTSGVHRSIPHPWSL